MTASKKPGQPGNAMALDDWGQREIVAMSSGSTTPVVMKAAQSGSFIVIPAIASGVTVTLPAPAAGLNYEFYCAGGSATAAGFYTFKTPTTGTMVAYGDAAADSITIGKTSGAPYIGGAVRFVSDGTLWYSIMEPAFTSAAPTSATMTEFSIQT